MEACRKDVVGVAAAGSDTALELVVGVVGPVEIGNEAVTVADIEVAAAEHDMTVTVVALW